MLILEVQYLVLVCNALLIEAYAAVGALVKRRFERLEFLTKTLFFLKACLLVSYQLLNELVLVC